MFAWCALMLFVEKNIGLVCEMGSKKFVHEMGAHIPLFGK
jgi:hypothetical protein